jgi:hypothetical protein
MNIYKKLNAARAEFHTLSLKKTGLNKFAGYEYFELSDFLIPAMKVLDKHGLCFLISFGKEVATMRIVDTDDGQAIEITSPMSTAALKGCHEVQNLGAVQSYLRRYLWVAALEIVEHDALDATTGKDKTVKGEAPIVTPRGGIGDDLPETEKQELRDIAMQIIAEVKQNRADKAREYVAAQKLEAEQKTWLWNQLDSKTRSALSKSEPINYMRA